MNEADKAAFEAGLAHRDAQPAIAQGEAVANHGQLYAWIYVDQYGLDSKSAAKEWCEEMIRLHGGSMFPLYTNPPADVVRELVEAAQKVVDIRNRVLDKSIRKFDVTFNNLEAALAKAKEHGL